MVTYLWSLKKNINNSITYGVSEIKKYLSIVFFKLLIRKLIFVIFFYVKHTRQMGIRGKYTMPSAILDRIPLQ